MNVYRCQDNKWLACGMFLSERFVWDEFCSVIEMPQLASDHRFRDDRGRSIHNRELIALLDEAFAKRPRAFWEEAFRQKGYWASVVNNIEDLVRDPQVAANNYLVEGENGVKTVTAPFSLEGVLLPLPRSAPAFGRDTDQILQDLGGYSTDEILELKTQGAIW